MKMFIESSLRRLLLPSVFASASLSCFPSVVSAQESPSPQPNLEKGFATQWNVVLAAEDLLVAGYTWAAEEEQVVGVDQPIYFTRKAWGTWNPVRFSADVFILPKLSVGTGLRIEHEAQTYPGVSGWGPSGGGATEFAVSSETDSVTTLRINPRVGYGTWFDEGWGAWVRAGVELASNNGSATPGPVPSSGSAYGPVLALSVDALAVLQPFPHTVVAFGPTYRRTMIDEGPGNHLLALALNAGVEF